MAVFGRNKKSKKSCDCWRCSVFLAAVDEAAEGFGLHMMLLLLLLIMMMVMINKKKKKLRLFCLCCS